ncbi:MAG: lycopene cyclase family protein [Spirochaetia bacterium]
MEQYDYIIAGGGAAGLHLAVALGRSSLRNARILIIDKDTKQQNDRTWCFWHTANDTPVPKKLLRKSWQVFSVIGEKGELDITLSPYTYSMIRGLDFYAHATEQLQQLPNCRRLVGTIDFIEDGVESATVVVDGTPFHGKYVFDSLIVPGSFSIDTTKYHFLKQHFYGVFVRTRRPVFQPHKAGFFDFRVPQYGVMRFVYTLPSSETEALVEYTLFSADLLPAEEYRQELTGYLHRVLGLEDGDYEVLESEDGVIPMSDYPFPRRGGERILYTGTKGGRVKGSTGFAFHRIARDAVAIVNSLEEHGHPFALSEPAPRYRAFDAMLLQILYRHGELGAPIFEQLFRRNPIDRLLRFLNEQTSLREDIAIMASVPWWPFIRAWLRMHVTGHP